VPGDLAAVEELMARTFGQSAGSAFSGVSVDVQARLRLALRRLEANPTDGLLVATDGRSVVGAIAVETAVSARLPGLAALAVLRPLGVLGIARFYLSALAAWYRPSADEAYLSALTVAPTHRRRGLAERLLRAAEQESARRGRTIVSALVAPTNQASLALFGKAGFHRVAPGAALPRPWVLLCRATG
jgi:ribosomal protein S18 acetylase RimI-like enzyme